MQITIVGTFDTSISLSLKVFKVEINSSKIVFNVGKVKFF